ncbi:competence protein CoiA [Enterococcus sp. LJL98]
MFLAEDRHKKIIFAQDYRREDQELIFCPGCTGEVIYKQGPSTMPHFAHRSRAECASFSEGETLEHLKGKWLLHQSAPQSQLEAYLSDLKQRPDLLWGKCAIEFQCSTLPIQRLVERTQNYWQHAYVPWWILGERLRPKKRQAFTALQKACCYYQKDQGVRLWSLDVKNQSLRCYHVHGWHFRQAVVYGIYDFPLDKYTLKAILFWPFPTPAMMDWSVSAFKQQLKRKLFQMNPSLLALQERFYLQGAHLLYLPRACYAPSRFFFFFEERLLYLRFCFASSASLTQWLTKITPVLTNWPFSMISQMEILRLIYEECQLQNERQKNSLKKTEI